MTAATEQIRAARIERLVREWPRVGRVVLVAEGAYEPGAAITAYLTEFPPSVDSPVHLVFGMRRTDLPALPRTPLLSIGTFVPGRGLRNAPSLIYHRVSYHDLCRALTEGLVGFDAMITSTSTVAAGGSRAVAGVSGYLQLVADSVPVVIAEEVPWLPDIPGAARVHADRVVPTEAVKGVGQASFSSSPPDDRDRAIAAHVIAYLPDAAALSLGIGRIPDAVADLVASRTDVSLLTGVVQPSSRRIAESGALGDRSIRAMSVVGGDDLLGWAKNDPRVCLEPSTLVHNPDILAAARSFVTVLGAIEVDLFGTVNSERVADRLVSGLGGGPDFAEGAHRSPDGVSIVALRSTAPNGLSLLRDRVAVESIPADLVDVVVTERGAADLRGVELADRAGLLGPLFETAETPAGALST